MSKSGEQSVVVLRHTSLVSILRGIIDYQKQGYEIDISSVREFNISKSVAMRKTKLLEEQTGDGGGESATKSTRGRKSTTVKGSE